MKKIHLDVVNEELYYKKMSNGLDVYIIRKKDFTTYAATFISNFGGLDLEFVPINEEKMITVPAGIAHFLEHKLFEQESGISVHEFYKSSGTYVNASTGYKKTKYVINGTSNFKENLLFLLDFVQSPYFTEENISKEKGIILQEAYMCLDDKNRLFNETIMKNLYTSIRYDKKIIGDIEDIKSISKEDLYKCYNSFYHPTNMALLIVCNDDVNEIFDIIEENQKNKKFKTDFEIKKKIYNESIQVKKEYEIIKTDVKENRLCYSLKLKLSDFDFSKVEVHDYLYIYLGIIIGNLSDFNLDLKNKRIIKDDIGYSINSQTSLNDEFITVHIYALTDYEDKFIELLEKELRKINIKEDLFDLYKKNIISSLNYNFNTVNGVMGFMISEYEFSNSISNNNINKELSINYNDFKKVIEKINLDNKSIVIMKNE